MQALVYGVENCGRQEDAVADLPALERAGPGAGVIRYSVAAPKIAPIIRPRAMPMTMGDKGFFSGSAMLQYSSGVSLQSWQKSLQSPVQCSPQAGHGWTFN